MRKLRKIVVLTLMSLVLLASLPITSYAHDVPDLDRDGSISLSLVYNNTAVTGGTFKLWRVGDVKEDDGNYSFEKAESISEYSGALDNIGSSVLAEDLASFVNQNGVAPAAAVNNITGTISFTALKPGLYLIQQTKASSGYQGISPFLVSVPQNENGTYVYDVSATPKIGTITPLPPTPSPTPVGPKLPQTGQLNWPIPVLACAGMLMFVIGWSLRNRKKNEDAE